MTSSSTIAAMTAGRQADSQRRRERVLAVLAAAVDHGDEITITGIAHGAGVDRTFLYRHHDVADQIHAAQTRPPHADDADHGVTRASLHADLLATQQRCTRLVARTRQLESRLSELLGEQTWHESGLGAPDDIDALHQRITTLEQQTIDLRLQLKDRSRDLDAARAANRELIVQLNTTTDP